MRAGSELFGRGPLGPRSKRQATGRASGEAAEFLQETTCPSIGRRLRAAPRGHACIASAAPRPVFGQKPPKMVKNWPFLPRPGQKPQTLRKNGPFLAPKNAHFYPFLAKIDFLSIFVSKNRPFPRLSRSPPQKNCTGLRQTRRSTKLWDNF